MRDTLTLARGRVGPPGRSSARPLAGTLAVLEYCARVYRRNWRGTLFMTFLSPILFLGAMGFGLGGLIGGGANPSGLTSASYAAFLAPGLLVATCMQSGTFEASYPIMGRLSWDRIYHAMLATPIAVAEIVAGQIAWFAVRLSLVATVFFGVMLGFGVVHGGPLAILVIPVGVLTGLSFAAPMAAFCATQRNDFGFSFVFRFVVTPLFLFSGTFFPVEQLPGFLQPVSWLTPTYHGVALARDLSLGLAALPVAVVHLAVLGGYAIGGSVAAYLTFRRALVR